MKTKSGGKYINLFEKKFITIGNLFFYMNRNSQITLFLILGLIVLAVVIFFYQFRTALLPKEEGAKMMRLSAEIQEINKYTQDCLERITEEGANFVGEKGRTLAEGEDYTLADATTDFSDYINENIVFCTADFEGFEGMTIKQSEPTTELDVTEEKVEVKLFYPLLITKDENTFKLSNFDTEVKIRLNTMFRFKEEIKKELTKKDNQFCLSCLDELAEEKNLKITILDYAQEGDIIVVEDETALIKEEPYQLMFRV